MKVRIDYTIEAHDWLRRQALTAVIVWSAASMLGVWRIGAIARSAKLRQTPMITLRQPPQTNVDSKVCPRCSNLKPYGKPGLASRAEVQDWYRQFGESMDMDLREGL